jgi:hypothetical protein
MHRDVDDIIQTVKQRLPSVQVVQMHKTHSGDDDGLWWFRLPGVQKDIQIESSFGQCPFVVEHSDMKSTSEAETARTVEEAAAKIVDYLKPHSVMNVIDMLSADPATGHALLHLLVEGQWSDIGNRMEWIRRRLNIYGAFVLTGQLDARDKFQGLAPKILLHCEVAPPFPVLTMLAEMKQYLLSQSIEMAVTTGHDFKTEIPLPQID